MRRLSGSLLFWFVCVMTAACSANDGDRDDADGGVGDADTDTDTDADAGADAGDAGGDTDTQHNGAGCTAMDILFIIDNSGSMAEEQSNLITNFPKFIAVLDDYQTSSGAPLEYRVAVTTTGVNRSFTQKLPPPFPAMPMTSSGEDGAMIGSKCQLDPPWIDGPGTDVATDFACAANNGTGGSGTEMPFAALENALGKKSEPGGPNEGFYRKAEGSLLVVVIITDEDDCSIENGGYMAMNLAAGSDCNEAKSKGLYTIERTKDFIDAVAGGPGRYVVVAIAGPKSCSSQFGDAIGAHRVQALIDACADYGVFGDICAGDLWIGLETALETMTVTCDDMPDPV